MNARPSRACAALSQAKTSATTASATVPSAMPLRLQHAPRQQPTPTSGSRATGEPAATSNLRARSRMSPSVLSAGRRAVHQAEADDGEPAEHRIHVEPGESAADAVAVARSAAVPSLLSASMAPMPKAATNEPRRWPSPRSSARSVCALAAVFECHGAEDQRDQHQHQRDVEGGEQRSVPEGERGEGGARR